MTTPARPPKHPPGPANFNRWIGLTWRHLAQLWVDPMQYASQLCHQHGDLTSFLLFTKRVYLVNSPELMQEYLVTRRDDYIKAKWQMRVLRQVMGDGLLTSEGPLWLRQRRLIQQAFRADTMDQHARLAVETTRDHLTRWPTDGQVDLVSDMAALSMAVSIRGAVGINPHHPDQPTPHQLAEAVITGAAILKNDMENPLSLPDWVPTRTRRAKRRVLSTLHRYVDRAIAIRRNAPGEHQDLLALLLKAVDTEGDGRGMSDRQARDEAITMLLAGNHATSATLGWFWKLVLGRPDIHARLVEEVDRVLGDRPARLMDLPQLSYVRQTLQETLRLFPAAWVMFARESVRPTLLAGYRLRRGAWVFAYPYVTHRDPRYFRDPLVFDPERFSPDRIDEIPSGAYFPFGHGPRACIGQHQAMVQLTLMIATLLQYAKLTPTPGCDDLATHRELSLRPATPCMVRVGEKKSARIQPPSLAGRG